MMDVGAGRPEKPLSPCADPLFVELRRLRERARLTYHELAYKTQLAQSTLTAAAGGEQVPSWRVTHAWVSACGGDERAVLPLWIDARRAAGLDVPAGLELGGTYPRPDAASTPGEFVELMKQLRTCAGNPSLQVLNRRSGGFLPPSTVSGVLRRDRLPRRDLLTAYVRACGLDEDGVQEWGRAWRRLDRRANHAGRVTGPKRSRTGGMTRPVQASILVVIISLICLVSAGAMTVHAQSQANRPLSNGGGMQHHRVGSVSIPADRIQLTSEQSARLAKQSATLAKQSARLAKRSARLAKKAGARLAKQRARLLNERSRLASERARLAKERANLVTLRKVAVTTYLDSLDAVPPGGGALTLVSIDSGQPAPHASTTVLVVPVAYSQSLGPDCVSLWSPATPAINPQRPLYAEPPPGGEAEGWLVDQFFANVKMCQMVP